MFSKPYLKQRKSVLGHGGKSSNNRVVIYSSLFLLCALLLSLPSRAETVQVHGLDFGRILVHGSVDVEVSQGDEPELVIRGKNSDLEQHPFFTDGDTLVLGRNQQHHSNFGNLKFKVTVANLEQLQLHGSGDVYVKPLVVEDLYVSVDGSGDIKLFGVRGRSLILKVSGSGDIRAVTLDAEEVKLVVSGSGDLQIGELHAEWVKASLSGSGDIGVENGGTVMEMDINIVGSGAIDFEAVSARIASVNIVGSGTVTLDVADELDVNIMGSGEVMCHGSPDVSQSVLGSGEVHIK